LFKSFKRKINGRGERGQMLLTAGLSMAVVLGFTAMAIDVGLAYQDRRDLQNDSDAAALAGVQHLPQNPGQAVTAARQWLAKNGITDDQVTTVEVQSTLVANDSMYVEVDDDFGWVFAKVLGLTTSNVGAQAKARVGSLEGNGQMMPWAILQGDTDCLDVDGNAIWNADCVVKVGAGSAISGWHGALDYDGGGGGSAEYESNIIDGEVETIYCADGDFDQPCPGNITVDDLDGNKVGGTGQGIEERLASGPACDGNGNGKDDFDEVFDTDPTGISDYVVICPDSPNVVVIPIVSFSSVPVQQVTIEGWTLAYLDYYGCVANTAFNIGQDEFVFAYDDVRVIAGQACANKAPQNTAVGPVDAAGASDSYVYGVPLAGVAPAPPACHQGVDHGANLCPTATPTPAPGTPTPSPTPAPSNGCPSGQGHWEVHIRPVNATYSQIHGYLGDYDPTKGITIRRLVE
jgi:hypothetical protein